MLYILVVINVVFNFTPSIIIIIIYKLLALHKLLCCHYVVSFQFVLIKEFTGEDTQDLYLEEREGQLRKEQEKKREQQLMVPGILNPHERPDEMQE